MNRTMRLFFVCVLLAGAMTLTGCANGPFVNAYQTEQLVQGPDGRMTRMVTTQTQDMSGTVAANAAGMAANILANGANAAVATNFGQGYPIDRQLLHGMTYPGSTGWNTNWGSNYGAYGGYYGGDYSYVPRGGILVQ